MGITTFSAGLVNKVMNDNKPKTVIELGAQNLYDRGNTNGVYPYAHELYEPRGIEYTCIDLNGENNAQVLDLSEPISIPRQFDLLTDFGTSEHVLGIYNCWVTKHKLLKLDGWMVNENPKVGNWPDHGYWYYTEDFYHKIAEACGYKIKEIGQHPAMGNTENGWNIYCVMQKVEEKDFMSEAEFMKIISIGDKQIPEVPKAVTSSKKQNKRKGRPKGSKNKKK